MVPWRELRLACSCRKNKGRSTPFGGGFGRVVAGLPSTGGVPVIVMPSPAAGWLIVGFVCAFVEELMNVVVATVAYNRSSRLAFVEKLWECHMGFPVLEAVVEVWPCMHGPWRL